MIQLGLIGLVYTFRHPATVRRVVDRQADLPAARRESSAAE
jgi:hypothetical protein